MSPRQRILMFEGAGQTSSHPLEPCREDVDLVRVSNVAEGLALLRHQTFDGVYVNPHDTAVWERAGSLLQADYILEVLSDGVALVNPDLRVSWANLTFERWAGGYAKGRSFYEALGSPEILGPDYCPFHTALAGKTATTRLHRRDNHYVELYATPIFDNTGKVSQIITLARDVTAMVQQQQKLDALHKAGRELAALSADHLSEMGVEERIELLKHNIRNYTHNLLHYDVIEIRLLDPVTKKLEPLLEEGMMPEAANRVLYASADGNGVTGFVAATGKSYLCPDTTVDPLYIEGAQGARSSLTVALTLGDGGVIGTFNVESPKPGGFGEQDLQFAEIFSREIASALHTLELLSAEQRSTAEKSIDAINREVALPVDEILTTTSDVLDRWIGHEPELTEKLRHILASARAIKQCINKVGEGMAPAGLRSSAEPETHPGLKGLRVLVVDNDERVRRSAHSLLGRFGCIVETARDGKQALTLARLAVYDAMLADIRLPDMSGYEVFQQLHLAQPKARVILMTAYGYDPSHSIVKAKQEGLRHVLFKPFRIDQLLTALENPDPANDGAAPQVAKA